MGICTLTFDQIQILNKKSDSRHSDNDWLIVTWFVGPNQARTDKIQLRNQNGSVILDTGDTLQPVSLSVDCTDADLVTATFLIVNLGSSDYSDQVAAVGKIAEQVSEKLAAIYVNVAEIVAAGGLPLGQVFSDGLAAVEPKIVQSVGAAWDDVIVPLVDDVVQFIQVLIGKPNCNGDVLHDIVMFKPDLSYGGFQSTTYTLPPYVASSKSGCGSPARTSIVYTLTREGDPVPAFPDTPPPATETAPEQSLSPAPWIGKWAEDSNTPTPIILVDIEPPLRESGSLSMTIVEQVDRRFGAVFDSGGDVLLPHTGSVFLFLGNVFASVRPLFHPTFRPGDLKMVTLPKLKLDSAGGQSDAASASALPKFALDWQRPSTAGGGIELRLTMIGAKAPGGSATSFYLEKGATIVIPSQGVTLFLNTVTQDGNTIAYTLRYIRAENALYTRADVLLTRWSPLG